MKRKSFNIHIELPSAWDWLNFIKKLLISIAVILTVFLVFMFVDEALSKTTTEGPFQAVVESVDTETRRHTHMIGRYTHITTDTIHVVTFTDSRRYEFYEENDWFKSIKEDDIITYYIYKVETPMLHITKEFVNDVPYDERNDKKLMKMLQD